MEQAAVKAPLNDAMAPQASQVPLDARATPAALEAPALLEPQVSQQFYVLLHYKFELADK